MSVEMKDSGINWIGEIPKHWEVSAIKRNFQLYSGATPKTDNELYWNGGVAWITPADYKTEDRWIECGSRYISEEGFKSCAVTMLPKGSIIFSKRAPIGLVIMNSTPLCTNQGCIGCVPFNGNGDYYYYAMSICSEQFELLGSGTTFKEISATSFSNFILPTPTIEEQYRIANFLDKKCAEIDELIVLQEQMIAQLTTYKQAVITETVTKGLDPNVKMKDSGVEWIGEIPEHWGNAKIKNFIALVESGVSVNAGGNSAGENEYGVLKTSSVSKYVFDITENKTVFPEEIERLKCPVKANTLIVSRMNTPELVGACGYVEENSYNIYLPDRLWQVHLTSQIHVKFVWYYLRSSFVKAYYSSLSSGTSSSMQNISQDQFANVSIMLPPLSEQQSIAQYLDQKCKEIDELISIKKEKIEHLKAYKKSVIYEYVTGKKHTN